MQYEKYQELQNKSQKMQDEYEKKMSDAETEKNKEVSEVTQVLEGKIKLLKEQIDQVGHNIKIYITKHFVHEYLLVINI